MTPHQVLSLLTQEQTADLLTACCEYLSVERVEAALRAGLSAGELAQLHQLISERE